uniref:Kelch domain-containing protein 10 n=1 Tax=Parastrongyloides trichosuri TaxID=131310 RepID=A0A0N5A655_PARTI
MPITKYCENVNNSNNVSKNEESEIFLLESEFLSRRITRRHANKASKSIKDDDDQIINSPFEDIKVFFVGGVTGRSREYYRPAKNIHFSSLYQRYEDFPQLDTPRMLTRLCQYKDNLYAVGGKSYSNNKWDSALELMVYDVDFESWTALDIYLDYDRVEHDVSVINDEMYIVGGNVEPEDKYGIVMYNFEKDYFSPIHSSYNDIVFQHTNIVRDNVIYIVGGYKNNQRKIIQLFDPRVGKVQMLLEPERQHLQSANILYNDTIYCFGGLDEKLNPTDNSDYFDIRANKWGSLEKMPSHRYACGAFIISNKVFVSGGIGVTTGTCREVEKYDIHGNKWFQGLNMVDGRGFFGVLQI